MRFAGGRMTIGSEVLLKEMIAAGERLTLALNLECELSWLISRTPTNDLVEQWKECRRSVKRFSLDYMAATGAYHRALATQQWRIDARAEEPA